MQDPRLQQLAHTLVHYSCALEKGDKVLIEAYDTPEPFVRTLVREAEAAHAQPLVTLKSHAVMRDMMLAASEEQMRIIGETEAFRMRQMDAYIGVRGNANICQWGDVPAAKMNLYRSLFWQPVHLQQRVNHTRWVVLRWPNDSMAQQANMSSEAFEDFYFDVCCMDYARMAVAMQPLRELMQATDRVRLVAPGTEISFSIKGIPAVSCNGKNNIPDGEVFTAPVRDSINGEIFFASPTVYQGASHERIRLRFEQGKIVAAESTNNQHLLTMLDTDEGARYVGEFAIGFNPYIQQPMKDILFDEKIAGSIHLTPGNAYEEADNGNRSEIHWDMVLCMTPDAGGGEIYFDDRLVRQDGLFVLPELQALNPENLTA